MQTLNEWAASVEGRYINVDGHFGGQCWDLAQHYAWNCISPDLTLYTRPAEHDGYAIGVWETILDGTAAGKEMYAYLDARTGDEVAQPGDIIIWLWGQHYYPMSHIAVVLEDRGDFVLCMSQNSSPGRPDLPGYSDEASGPAIRQVLPKLGIAGYLRPRPKGLTVQGATTAAAPKPAPKKKVSEMPKFARFGPIDRSKKYNTRLAAGRAWWLKSADGKANLNLAGTGLGAYDVDLFLEGKGLPAGEKLTVDFQVVRNGRRSSYFKQEITGSKAGTFRQGVRFKAPILASALLEVAVTSSCDSAHLERYGADVYTFQA